MRAVDTNVLVRLVTRDDEVQFAAAARFIENGAWVSVLALAETIWVLGSVFGAGATEQATGISTLLDNPSLTFQDPDIVQSALDLFRSRPSLSFSDCLLLEIARKAGHLPLGTFDRQLAKVDGAQRL